ncbi:M20 family metallo-hydrolase [Paenibacillus rhizophilus]|uniref:Zn-dependent hydrolase n=2 Tax=Paenibacillus rhizophilus TaxID=1850366 RepID=A0A3N9P2R9_9BACL|nr:M20 family metallo-hydrolase [Paenibacillus rhizophilus]RQW09767.1 Zn-dependent hydrolase [Paenibacillus rhizophilus]
MSASFIQSPAAEMMELLDELSAFSAPGDGVTRLLYTPEWKQAQQFLLNRVAESGLTAYSDSVGNVYGRLTGTGPDEKVVLTGSHIDTVVRGGKYDGAYGVAAAFTALRYLSSVYGSPLRTLEAVSFAEEEGSRFPLTFWGSGSVTGLYDGGEAENCKDAEGVTLQEAMESCSLSGEESAAPRNDIAAYVELHIEQGIVLERTGTQIGVVSAIAGQRRFAVSVKGTANHAGTTPMGLRRDALAAAAEMVLQLERSAAAAGDPLVATTGRLEAFPNTPNVIPGEVVFTLDIRHSKEDELEAFCAAAASAFEEIAKRRDVTVDITARLSASPAPMDSGLSAELEAICTRQGRTYRTMVSGAGHDAQLFAPRSRTAMIFVPSRAGISHSPEEYTPPEELAAGLDVLIALLYKLGYEEMNDNGFAPHNTKERWT